MNLIEIIKENANPARAKISQRFFKTGPGEYGEGDIFLGLSVPQCRTIAKRFSYLDLGTLKKHLNSKVHEERLIAWLVLVEQFMKTKKKELVDFYLDNLDRANNWDLVDLTADKILGAYLLDNDKRVLYDLARSDHLWKKRVSIVATYQFIKKQSFDTTLEIANILMQDTHDLIHKAVGWMLREIGKRDVVVLEHYLKKHYQQMPRTMLRYAIERFSPVIRKRYLGGHI